MLDYIQERRDKITIYLQFFVFYLIAFGIMLNRHYSTDSFAYSSRSAIHYKGHLETARIGSYFASYLFKNINIIDFQAYFIVLLILALAICSGMIYNHYIQCSTEDNRSQFLLKIMIAVMFGNVYMTDFFYFPEAIPPMVCGLLFMALAVLQVEEKMALKKILFMLIFITISLNCYQVTLGYFAFFTLANIYIIHKGSLTVTAFWDSIKVLFCGGLAGVFNVILLKVLQKTGIVAANSRTETIGAKEILINAKQIIREAYQLFCDPWGFLPKHVLLIIILALYILIAITIWQRKDSWLNCLYIVLVILASRILLYMPHLLASVVWMAPRSIISYWSIVAIPCTVLAVLSNKRAIKNVALFVAGVFAVINILSIQKIGVNIISSNRLDQEISYMIQDKIEKYELESGQEIETILFRNDIRPVYSYHSIDFAAYELATREYTVSWGCIELINYYNSENYEYGIMDDETFYKYFTKSNWDYLNLDEQLVFEGNTAYYAVY